MNRPFAIAWACGLISTTFALAQPGSLFDPENARVTDRQARPKPRPAPSSTPIDADVPQSAFPLTEKNGPVLVRVASFSGELNAQYAEALAKELRERHKLAAYVFRYQAEYSPEISDEDARKYKEQFGVAPRRYVPLSDSPANWTVLVGDFPSFEDKAAQKTLAAIRNLNIQSVPERVWKNEMLRTWDDADARKAGLEIDRDQFTRGANVMNRAFQQFRDLKVQKKGHLSSAMLVRNPHPRAPRQARNLAPETAKMLLDLNTTTPYSVYENKNAYTLVVAQFQGGMDVGDKKSAGLFSNGKIANEDRSPLTQAAKQSISLCEALRKIGLDAYVFHGQYASLVCVGGFPEKFDLAKEEFQDPRVRARLMSGQPEVNEFRQKLATVTIGNVPLAPFAELIVTPRPPDVATRPLAN